MKGITQSGERKEMVEALLHQTNLWDSRKKALGGFSGGMKQRFGIAQALLANPKLIIVAMREATPPDLQYLVTDMFESIVLYENKAVTATYTETPGHKYKVTLKIDAQKREADGQGNESPMAMHDLIDIGVFSGQKEHLKQLHFEKMWITKENETLEFVVDEKPTFAGIDPYNKLIDREPEDNLIEVEKK
jgi:hypothetical protein